MKLILAVVSVLSVSVPARLAAADEWGCEVLLCAASSNPSWHSVPECHAPMGRLISAMKAPGFSWPTCPEGGAGKPGYEPFSNCPPGWSATEGGVGGAGTRAELSRCMRVVNDCRGGEWASRGIADHDRTEVRRDGTSRVYHDNRSCAYTEYMARPRREQPYYFDIGDETGDKQSRIYFDLRR
ncbi:hypothetical protein ATY81_22035 [Rhizobium sp. R72]|uniref:hypothetical protein n=1 Tax=unclassified Rhizobium TaxID=2613769 RepID=UPI000B538B1F|nr:MULTISPECIES: hypothetical protein [unclassified Rhizobium]OWW02328.1 hypothetical protein ATY81_22035 [Rhizobium sp. R72]OWW02462.1 hypothetical protein ATY80_22035 [Rhizobium sp. R711]